MSQEVPHTELHPACRNKRPHDIEVMLERIRQAVRQYPKAALFQLAEDGFRSPFEQLVACIISVRTTDEVTVPVARRLFAVARTPEEVCRLTSEGIDRLIHAASFHEAKARNIKAISTIVLERHGGEVPCREEVLRSFPGVGPKCTNLVLGISCGQPRIAVDTHVHRITNRWGYVRTRTPEQTLRALEQKLPRRHWVEINALLVPFGKHICTPRLPRCSVCPVLEFCQQVGVVAHR